MADENLPWFKMYPQRFMGDENVQLMGPTELGVYFAMLMHEWKAGAVPDDPDMVARICRGTRDQVRDAWDLVRPCFEPHPERDGYIIQPRLEKERQDAVERRERARKAGEASGEARTGGSTDGSTPRSTPRSTGSSTGGSTQGRAMRASNASDVQKVRVLEETDVESGSEDMKSSGQAAVEKLRDALCGAIREHGWVNGTPEGWSMGREVSVADSLDHDYGELVEAVRGLRLMVRRGNEAVEGFIAPGDSFTLRCFARQEERGMPLVKLARHAWRKWGAVEDDRSPRGGGELEHVGASVVAGEDP